MTILPISMDYITDLAPCGGLNGISTCIDKLTKFVKVISVSIGEGALLTPEVARLFFEHVVRLFGISHVLLYNHNAHFIANFWRCLWQLLVLRLHYHQPTIHSWMGRLNILIGQWNRLSTVLYLSGGLPEDH